MAGADWARTDGDDVRIRARVLIAQAGLVLDELRLRQDQLHSLIGSLEKKAEEPGTEGGSA